MRRTLRRFTGALICLALAAPFGAVQPVRAVSDCKDVHVVWATGANSSAGGTDVQAFSADLTARVLAPMSLSFFELATPAGFNGLTYHPADSAALFQQGLGVGSGYADSVAGGRDMLNAYLQARATDCPSEVYVLGGWSEGADVIGSALPLMTSTLRSRIAFVALFGDPRLDTGNNPGFLVPPPLFPPGCFSGQKPWIRGDIPCYASGGIFGSRAPYLPSDITTRVGSWCRHTDAACEGGWLDIPACCVLNPPFTHGKYFDPASESAQAAREAAARLATYVPAHAASFDATWDEFVDGQAGADLAIVFDTTGSMGGSISNAQTQAASLAQQWTSLYTNGRVGLVEYKDQGDTFVSRVDLGLTSSASAFQTAVNQLSAVGGGDTPEAELSGIMTALDGLSWANGATKAVVVITDAEGKDPEPVTNFTRASVDQHALNIDPVAIYGVNVSTLQSVSDWMAPMAAATAGTVVTLQPGQSLSDALSALFSSVHASPVAKLVGPIFAQPNTTVTLDASGSFDAAASITGYAWDFDGNGTADQTTSTATTTHTYTSAFHGMASVRVSASDGRSALATTDVSIDSVGLGGNLPIAPSSAAAAVRGSSQVTITWTPTASDRADAYKVYLADGTTAQFVAASDPHTAVLNGVDLSHPTSFAVTAWNSYGQSIAVATGSVGGGDTTPPVSRASAINATYTANSVAVPYTASDSGGSGVASVELWARYRANESRDWGTWTRASTATTSPITYTFASGDGNYEFYTVAVDGAGNREAAPSAADAATMRDATDDPPDFNVVFTCSQLPSGIGGSYDVVLVGSGTAADDRSTVTVSWDLYGVSSNGHRSRLFSFKNAMPTDGAFNSRVEGFELDDDRLASGGVVSYSLDVKVTAGASSVTRTYAVTIPPPTRAVTH